MGDKVEARYLYGCSPFRHMFKGMIQEVNADGTYHVAFDDGDFDERVKIEDLIPAPLSSPSVRVGITHLFNYQVEEGIWAKPDDFSDSDDDSIISLEEDDDTKRPFMKPFIGFDTGKDVLRNKRRRALNGSPVVTRPPLPPPARAAPPPAREPLGIVEIKTRKGATFRSGYLIDSSSPAQLPIPHGSRLKAFSRKVRSEANRISRVCFARRSANFKTISNFVNISYPIYYFARRSCSLRRILNVRRSGGSRSSGLGLSDGSARRGEGGESASNRQHTSALSNSIRSSSQGKSLQYSEVGGEGGGGATK